MRAFIAIDLPADLKDSIARLQSTLKKSGADVKWVAPSNIHLTLKFLGEIDDTARNAVSAAITEIADQTAPFIIKPGHIGAFPRIQSPRVIWISLAQGHEQTKAIADRLESRLETCGIAKETRPFTSHITIARSRSSKNIERLTRALSEIDTSKLQNWKEFQAGKITLFKSILTPQGPIYEILQETNLKTT